VIGGIHAALGLLRWRRQLGGTAPQAHEAVA
jgi:hypothetical protein